jgi:ATP adenylyltransferase
MRFRPDGTATVGGLDGGCLSGGDLTKAALTLASAGLLLAPLNMQQLHAYWRMEYIEAPRYPARMKRPFTELPALKDDRAALIVHRSSKTYLVLNRFPYNPGHLLAVPFREVTDLEELTSEESAELMTEIIWAKRLLTAAVKPDGFNVGFNLGSAAGGSIPHLHAHVVPRWNGDTNFMPVIGQTRTLPQSLDAMWERLSSVTADLKSKSPETTPRRKRARSASKVGR